MSISSFEDLMATTDLKVVEVDTSEWWGSSVYVREFDAYALEIFTRMTRENDSPFDVSGIAIVCALTLCDEGGKLLVDRGDFNASVETLKARNFQALNAVSMAALKASGLTSDELDEAGND